MILTAQQKQAMIMIEKFIADKDSQVFILKGYAGTGKTTLIRSIADYLSTQSLHIQLMAPTGRAAKILRSKLPNYGASTIHRGIYNFSHLIVEESEGTLKYIFPLKDNHERCIYIIDEASMISSRESKNELFQFGTGVLIKDLLSYARLNFGGKVIFVGDPMQLPPVGDDCSVALDETYFDILEMNVYSYELTDIVRQDKNSCILANATILRELIRKKERNRLVFKKKEHEVMDIGAMEVAKKYCEDPEQSSAIVCFSNQQAADYNTAIRNIIFPETNHVAVGDKLMVVCNSYYYDKCELLNGDIITVVETSNDIISQSAPIWTEKNGRKVKEIITLDFREISFQVEDGNIYKRYIIDTLLQNKRPSLTIDEMKALYINMVMRMRTEKGLTNPKSEEFTKAMWGDPFYNALHVKYGYAFTCHKSQGGEWNTVYVDCNVPQAKLATYTTREFSNVPPHFIASNAMRVYISPQYEHTEEDDFGVNLTTKYYIVFIDLTGERPPNNANWTEEKPCDVVAFLVTDGADVVPLGPPEVDTRYVTATVSYPATIDNPEETFSQPMSYWDAKHVAWGNNVDSTEMMSLHFDRDLPASSPLKVNYPTPPALNEVKGCTEKTSPCDVVFEQYY